MLVYVISKDGQPLMPTSRCGKVRRMLKRGKAKVIKRCPFTIQLLYEPETAVIQPVEVGDDTGSKHNGISAIAIYPDGRTKEVYASEVQMRQDVTKNMSVRREMRRSRRNRKTRYRKPRFDNRVRSKHKGWLPPTVENKIQTHRHELLYICSILPVARVTIETASFDLQKLKADLDGLKHPEGTDYQKGEQLGFWNVREYVLFRDGHICQCCKGKRKDPILNVHHIESRQIGGDAPNNLITLCETCHKAYHAGKIKLPADIKRKSSFRDAAFMGIMRWAFYNAIRDELTPKGIDIHMTYGYLTKNTRIRHGLPKTHCMDARCIAGHPEADPLGYYFYKQKVRCHNRQILKMTIGKHGIRKANQAPYLVKGFRLNDIVTAKGSEWFVHGRRSKGSFVLATLNNQKLEISPSKIRFVSVSDTYLTERRKALPTLPIEEVVPALVCS